MSAQYSKYLKFGSAIVIIVLALAYLAYTGVQESKSYYKTISELQTQASQSDAIYKMRLRVAGNVATGSIKRQGMRIEFKLVEQDKTLPVVYQGTEAPPDTFKDGAQALAEGQFGRDGVFHATGLQAKCASKYAPAQNGQNPTGNTQKM
ncbi:MAG TPA: cytochrome c maturation protein CcmE [Terriglobales bacterium]|jgi:cytochrome c-type biogenesis protein CcmE|nr:cytochrome c maturation protein CcmE [Terriglobales bacterium]